MKNRLLLLGLLVCALGCDSASPVAPSGSVLSITANPTQINLNGGTARITVTGFKPDGNPLNPGTQLVMSTDIGDLVDPSTGALISVIEVAGNGQALALLRADGRPGTAMVTATLTTGGDATAMATVQIGETPDSQQTVIISANPTTIAVRAPSRISLLGRNSDNTPVSSGERFRLTSDLGVIVADGGNSNSPPIDSVLSNSNGEAFVTYIAGDRGGTGEVRALLGRSEEVMIAITIRDAIDSLFLSPETQTIQRSDEGVMITFTATLRDAQGEPVSGTLVNFDSRGSFDNNAPTSDSNGIATATLTVRRIDLQDIPENGSFTVTATAISEGNQRSDSSEIIVLGAP